MSAKIPGSVPRNCDTTYRGYLTREKPKRITLESGRELVKARMGVSMPASTVSPEERDSCTEWVNVVAMNPAQMERLERCQPQNRRNPEAEQRRSPRPTGTRHPPGAICSSRRPDPPTATPGTEHRRNPEPRGLKRRFCFVEVFFASWASWIYVLDKNSEGGNQIH